MFFYVLYFFLRKRSSTFFIPISYVRYIYGWWYCQNLNSNVRQCLPLPCREYASLNKCVSK